MQASASAEAFRKVHPREYYTRFTTQGVRPDGRALSASRALSITPGAVGKADGSAMVRLGDTTVLGTVRAEVTKAMPESLDSGRLAIKLVITPLASPAVRAGRPNDAAAAISNMLERIMTSSEAVRLQDLAVGDVAEGMVWILYCDLYCLDYAGNVADAALVALLAALQDTKLPTLEAGAEESDELVVSDAPPRCLTLQHIPAPLSFAVVGLHIVADPTFEEECLGYGSAEVDAALLITGGGGGYGAIEVGETYDSFTVVTDENQKLCGVHKPGGSALSEAQLRECVELARARSRHIASLLEGVVAPQ